MSGKMTSEELEEARKVADWLNREGTSTVHRLLGHITALQHADPYTAMVREFHERMGLVVRDAPSLGTPVEREERVRLMLEELLEFADTLGVDVLADRGGKLYIGQCRFVADGHATLDVTAALHELADLQVTVSGTAVQFGLPLLAATREVHSANMRKTSRGPGRKPLKPDGWKPADVSRVLAVPAAPPACLASDECGILCQERCTVAESRRLGMAALQEAPGAVLRQLAGADPSQPASAVLAETHVCDPVCLKGIDCDCTCHTGAASAAVAAHMCDRESHVVNGFCPNCSDGWL